MKKSSIVYLFPVLVCFSACKTMREAGTAYSRREDCSRFVYCAATLALIQGDTIRGRFTMLSGVFYQIHENNDSNINRTGNENGDKNSYYPVSTWYKRFKLEEINTFSANGQTFQTVVHAPDENGNNLPWNSSHVFYLPKLSPDSAQLQLYRSFTPHSHSEEKVSGWADLLGEIVSDMLIPGYYTYYIHFPADTFHKVWMIDQSPTGLAAKAKMADLFSTCPELQSLAVQIKESPARQDLIHAMLSREELKYPKTIPAMLAIFKKYDDWVYRGKN